MFGLPVYKLEAGQELDEFVNAPCDTWSGTAETLVRNPIDPLGLAQEVSIHGMMTWFMSYNH